MRYRQYVEFSDLRNKVFNRVDKNGDSIKFTLADGSYYLLEHRRDCCENVYIESIVGDLSDLVDTPILMAEETYNNDLGRLEEYDKSFTWTFYKLASIKGYVDIRFYGTSNGYYSETASLYYFQNEE